jgi:hypothetical protein
MFTNAEKTTKRFITVRERSETGMPDNPIFQPASGMGAGKKRGGLRAAPFH